LEQHGDSGGRKYDRGGQGGPLLREHAPGIVDIDQGGQPLLAVLRVADLVMVLRVDDAGEGVAPELLLQPTLDGADVPVVVI
jgi:hypothetical protein